MRKLIMLATLGVGLAVSAYAQPAPHYQERYLTPIQPPMKPPLNREEAKRRAECMRAVDRWWATKWDCAASFDCTVADTRRYQICE